MLLRGKIMKKTILSLLLIVCSVFVFTACGNELGDKYWETVADSASEIFTSEDFDAVYNITYSGNLQSIISNDYGSDYAELTNVFKPLFTSAIALGYYHYNDFLMSPKNENKEFKKAIKVVKKELEEFKTALQVFNEKKLDYESNITFTSSDAATSDLELSRLLFFKRDYITVIESAYELSNSVFEARRFGYYDLVVGEEELTLSQKNLAAAFAVSASNLQIVNTAIKIVRSYNAKNTASEYQNYWNAAKNYHDTVVVPYENEEFAIAQNANRNFKNWLGVYELFLNDTEEFVRAIKEINVELLKKKGNDPEAYAAETGREEDKVFAEYFLNFYQKIATLKQYTLGIFE